MRPEIRPRDVRSLHPRQHAFGQFDGDVFLREMAPAFHHLVRLAAAAWNELLEEAFAAAGDRMQAGVRIFEYRATFMHAKVVLIDDELSLIGSPNFDNSSTELNRELALAARDAALVEALDASTPEDLADSGLRMLSEDNQ